MLRTCEVDQGFEERLGNNFAVSGSQNADVVFDDFLTDFNKGPLRPSLYISSRSGKWHVKTGPNSGARKTVQFRHDLVNLRRKQILSVLKVSPQIRIETSSSRDVRTHNALSIRSRADSHRGKTSCLRHGPLKVTGSISLITLPSQTTTGFLPLDLPIGCLD